MHHKKNILYVFLSLSFLYASSQQIVIDNYPYGVFKVNENIEILTDHSKKMTIETIMEGEDTLRFKRISGNYFSDGFSDAAYWLKLTLKNTASEKKKLYLEIEYPMLNYVDFYETIDENLLRTVNTGELRAFKTRDLPSQNFVFKLHLFPGKESTYYVRIYNSGETVRIPVFIADQWAFYRKSLLGFGIQSFFYGLLFFAFIFNLLLFFSIKERLYLLFSLYILALTLFMFSVDGLAYQFLWSESPHWQNKSTIVLIYLVHFFLLAFADNFIRYRRYMPVFHKINIATGAIVLLLLAGTLLPYPNYRYIAITANLFTLILLFVVILGSFFAVLKGRKTANLFIFSFLFLLMGSFTYVLRNIGVISDNIISQYGLKFGLTFQVVFLCFTVFERFKAALTERKKHLEAMVLERTEQIEEQKSKIEEQRDSLMDQHQYIQKQNKEITDSIRYAERIQKALLPDPGILKEYFSDCFVLYEPRDIVSGDFYWITEKNDKIILVTSDCTGHGVPGGFMSVLGITCLNEVLNEFNNKTKDPSLHAAIILEMLTEHVVAALQQKFTDSGVKDSMDMTVCIFDRNKNEMEFAGANNPVYIIHNGSLAIYKGTKMTVGLNPGRKKKFSNQTIPLSKDDVIYCFSDGYIDQLGGKKTKTFQSVQFQNLLLKIHKKSCKEQQNILSKEIYKWKGDNEQTDDMLVLGVKY